MDPVIVKAFINLTGIYPVGTLVLLDTFELGIVQAPNPIEDLFSRPMIRVISDEQMSKIIETVYRLEKLDDIAFHENPTSPAHANAPTRSPSAPRASHRKSHHPR